MIFVAVTPSTDNTQEYGAELPDQAEADKVTVLVVLFLEYVFSVLSLE